jgi:hypothetical protein
METIYKRLLRMTSLFKHGVRRENCELTLIKIMKDVFDKISSVIIQMDGIKTIN